MPDRAKTVDEGLRSGAQSSHASGQPDEQAVVHQALQKAAAESCACSVVACISGQK